MYRGKFTIIGFNKETNDPSRYYHCPIHQDVRLIPMSGEEGMFKCTECGLAFNPSEVFSETHITSRFSTIPNNKKIVSLVKKPKKYYDKFGNELPTSDPDIMNDIAQGRTIVSYHTTEDIHADPNQTRIIRKR